VIGLIHQEFEVRWSNNENRTPSGHGFGILLSILNVPELREKRYILEDNVEAGTRVFCAAVTDILGTMPTDETTLLAAHAKNELAGHRLDSFSGYAQRAKFFAFRDFIETLRERP
jgi:hypothetical protein